MATNQVRWIATNVLKGATLSVSTEVDGLPRANILDPYVRKVYRTTGKENEYITFQASGGATALDGVFVVGNWSKSALILWQGGSTSDFTSPTLNTTIGVATDAIGRVIPKVSHFYDDATSHEFWRLYVEDSSNATNLEFGIAFAGRTTRPTQDLREGFHLKYVDPSRRKIMAGRQHYANIRGEYQEFQYSVFSVAEPQQDQLIALYRQVGEHTAFVFALDPVTRPSHHTAYVQIENPVEWENVVLRQRTLSPLTLSEKR